MADANATTMAIWREIDAAFPGRFRFTSGCRTPEQNANVNGNANSYHLTTRGCQAADFVPRNGNFPSAELGQIAAIVSPHGYEVIKHNAGSGMHYHIEPAPGYTGEPSPIGDDGDTAAAPSDNTLYYMAGLLLLILLLD